MTKTASRNLSLVPRCGPVVRALLDWFAANARDLPWRRTCDPYAIWISEIMLQQTQVATVIPYWRRWMRALPTLESVAKARPARLRKLWEGLGYYTRVRNLHRAARQILRRHRGQFPQIFDDILALPGVGRYTAGAIASIVFNQPKPILDGNVTRVLTRLFAIQSSPRGRSTNPRLWRQAEELVREASSVTQPAPRITRRPASPRHPKPTIALLTAGPCSALNQSLMELGAGICTPRNPRCEVCPLSKLCCARRLGIVDRLLTGGERKRGEARCLAAFLVTRRGHILARQRPDGVVNARFWELPHVELPSARQNLARCARNALGIAPTSLAPLSVVAHHITRCRFRVEVFEGKLLRPLPGAWWLSPSAVRNKAFTGMDRKILRRLREP